MSPFGRLCLLVFVGLILPTREATPNQMEIHTQQPTEMDVLLTTGPGTDKSRTQVVFCFPPRLTPALHHLLATLSADPTQGPTPPKTQLPRKNVRTDPALRQTGSSEDDPFSYDEGTLRKRGLLVAAVLFITGIVILTSGKCRQLPRLCRSHDR
ncbi:FXYD domain-containing ion transport regulator 5 [Phocoena phocoena]|uniref:FXYD domain-containing ion transport regulator 5 n=1 Tax=Phocoena phocoena TaxID=9742 RepID=UPI0033078BCA